MATDNGNNNDQKREATHRRYSAAYLHARELINAKIRGELPESEEPALILAAEFAYDYRPDHQCYWNDSFCVAVMCDLTWEKQQQAAWCAVCNGLNDYWEWHTHAGYEMAKVLRHIGIQLSFEPPPPPSKRLTVR